MMTAGTPYRVGGGREEGDLEEDVDKDDEDHIYQITIKQHWLTML